MHAHPSGSFARTAPTPEALRVDGRSLEVYQANLERPAVRATLFEGYDGRIWRRMLRTDDASRPLTRVGEQMIKLYGRGNTEAQLRLFPIALHELCDRLFARHGRRSLDVLDMAQRVDENRANELFTRRRTRTANLTPAQLRLEAQANRRAAVTQLERAAALEAWALDMERTQVRAVERLSALAGH